VIKHLPPPLTVMLPDLADPKFAVAVAVKLPFEEPLVGETVNQVMLIFCLSYQCRVAAKLAPAIAFNHGLVWPASILGACSVREVSHWRPR
jgi:hypothetical protein